MKASLHLHARAQARLVSAAGGARRDRRIGSVTVIHMARVVPTGPCTTVLSFGFSICTGGGFLRAGTISQAVQPAVHDVTDASALRSWLNPPLGASLAAELYKATNIVRGFAKLGALAPERSIPAAVLDGAAGFAILSVIKVGGRGGYPC